MKQISWFFSEALFRILSNIFDVGFLRKIVNVLHCVKSVHIRSFSGPYFPAFGLNKQRSKYLSVFNPNAGKYVPKKLQIRTLLRSVKFFSILRKSGYQEWIFDEVLQRIDNHLCINRAVGWNDYFLCICESKNKHV